MNLAILLLVSVVTPALCFAAGWAACNFLKDRRAERAEQACEELRKQVMRGSTIAKVARTSTSPLADPIVEVVAIDGVYHAFTDSPLPRARALYIHLTSTQQIKPLPPLAK